MKLKETKINQGGLMRCCLGHINDYVEARLDEEATDRVIFCPYHADKNEEGIRLKDGVWEWNRK